MKPRGGYNVCLVGEPAGRIQLLDVPETLFVPLQSRRLSFSELRVEDGCSVACGQILAIDPDNHSIPLLAPCAGTVRLGEAEGHVVLHDLTAPAGDRAHVSDDSGSADAKRRRLLEMGAWQFVSNVQTGRPADPTGTPGAVIVSMVHLEPFVARGSVLCADRLDAFVRGLEHLQTLLEYQTIHLVLPDLESPQAHEIHEMARGHAWTRLTAIPLKMRYPFDNPALLGRYLGLFADGSEAVWFIPIAGVLAFDDVLTHGRPCTRRVISLAGPAVAEPTHVEVVGGYPIEKILAGRLTRDDVRVINGGMLTGDQVAEGQLGIDVECCGLTVMEEPSRREMLGFTRPGFDRRSYSRCFLSTLRGAFSERLNTALRGERRACVACGQCVEVCPAGIMPNVIHKCLYGDELEKAQQLRTDLCVECGLCSYVCPSKIDLSDELARAKEQIARELGPRQEADA